MHHMSIQEATVHDTNDTERDLLPELLHKVLSLPIAAMRAPGATKTPEAASKEAPGEDCPAGGKDDVSTVASTHVYVLILFLLSTVSTLLVDCD